MAPIAAAGTRSSSAKATAWSGRGSVGTPAMAQGMARPQTAIKASRTAQARSGWMARPTHRGTRSEPTPSPAMNVASTVAAARDEPPAWTARS
ncbi:hypothetical protein EBR56_06515 [bacterium]|nr:hypothetical protein [bacterium]